MLKLTIELETVTPLFLSGADQQIAELRAPAVRGALRYWLRALLGAGLTTTDVYKAESNVFGTTSQGSAVALRLQGQPPTQAWYPPHAQAGMQYLLFSIRQRDPQTRQDVIRPSIPAGTPFSLIIQQRVHPADPTPTVHAMRALWLLCNLGGLGARSRRGVGSLKIRSVSANHHSAAIDTWRDHLQAQPSTPTALVDALHTGVRPIPTEAQRPMADIADFDILHPRACRIIVVNRSWKRWDDALEALGQHFKQFRSHLDEDRWQVRDMLQRGADEPETIERAAFGLPIVFFYRGIGQSSLEGENHDRRASPLHFHITKLANGSYTIVLTCFKAQLLADQEQLKLPPLNRPQDRHHTKFIKPPDLTILDEFLNQLNGGVAPLGEPLEVAL